MNKKSKLTTLETIKRYTTIFLIICIGLECAMFPAPENVLGCVAELYGWILVSRTVMKKEYLQRYFIPFITITCYAYSFFVLPIGVTLIEGKPISFRFSVPYLTFFNLMLNVTTIVLAFHACRHIYKEGWLTRLWERLGYFTPPTQKQVWVLAFLAFGALLWDAGRQGTDLMEKENLGAIGQFLAQFRSFAYVPITLLFFFYWNYGKNVAVKKKLLVIYFVCLSIVAIATTRRTIMLNMAVTWAVMAFFIVLLENRQVFTRKNACIFLIAFYLITGPVADLALAMIINRQSVKDSTTSETLSEVVRIYSDKEALHKAFQMGSFSNSDNGGDNFFQWSEYYIDNIFFNRFCNLRTQDITLDYAQKLGYGTNRMKKYAENYIFFTLPTPILRAIGYEGNKFDYLYTPGDLLSTDALSLRTQYRGFRVCGDSAVGLAWMGYWYYPMAFLIITCVFYFFSSIVSTRRGFMLIPIPTIVGMVTYMTYFNNATGIFRSITLLLRNGWQDIIIYCLIMYIIRKIIK